MNIVCQRRKALPGARRGGRKGISEVQMVRKLTVFLLFCGLAGGALAAAQHDVVPASTAQLPALGADRRGGSLEFAEFDISFDDSGINKSFSKIGISKIGINKSFSKIGINKSFSKIGMNKSFNKIGMNKSFNKIGINESFNIGINNLASAIRGSSGVTIINAPAEGAAIESHTGPTIMRAPGATQE